MTAGMRPQSQNFCPRAEPTEAFCDRGDPPAVTKSTPVELRRFCDRGDAPAVTKFSARVRSPLRFVVNLQSETCGAEAFCDRGDAPAVTKFLPACGAH